MDSQIGGFSKENVRLLVGKDASTKNIRKGLYDLRRCTTEDLVIIFFSGHGTKQRGECFWVTQNAELADLGPTALPNAELQRLLAAIPSERIVTLLDCCYAADTVLNQKSIVNVVDLASVFTGKGRVTIAGAGGSEEAIEVDSLKQSAFAHFVVQGLRGKADANGDGLVTLMELWHYLEPNVERIARENKGVQKPTMHMETGQQTHRFLLTVNPEAIAIRLKRLEDLNNQLIAGKITGNEFDIRRKEIMQPAAEVPGTPIKPVMDKDGSVPPEPPPPKPELDGFVKKERSEKLGGDFFVNSIGMRFVSLPSLGDHYYMGAFEVTNKEYRQFKEHHTSGWSSHGKPLNKDDQPVVRVSWKDATSFCEWLIDRELKKAAAGRIQKRYIYRLPTSGEWESACRCEQPYQWAYSWGDDLEYIRDFVWFNENSSGQSHPVGMLKPNKWGLFDMHGNVWEWCQTPYEGKPGYYIIRGGSWGATGGWCKTDVINGEIGEGSPKSSDEFKGFRVVRCIDE